MDWQQALTVINTLDTALGAVFLVTSWFVGKSWIKQHNRKRDSDGQADDRE